MQDLISRQAAIDALKGRKRGRIMSTTKSFWVMLFAIIVILIGWFLGGFFFEKRDYDYNYEHFLMQENGYNYCPYCGEELKIEYKEVKE